MAVKRLAALALLLTLGACTTDQALSRLELSQQVADDGHRWVRPDLLHRSLRQPTTTTLNIGGNWCLSASSYSGSGLSGYGRGCCPQWHDVAISAGWSEGQWPTLSRLIYAESHCDPGARNPNNNGPYGHARGLAQVMDGLWPPECGISRDDLYDPYLNLVCAKHVYDQQGWQAWATY